MDETTRQILKGRIVSILSEEGDEQVNLTSRIVCEKIADVILKTILVSLEEGEEDLE